MKQYFKVCMFVNMKLFLFIFLFKNSNNDAILKYAESNIGRKVGRGVCNELIDSSIVSIAGHFKKGHKKNYYYDLKKVSKNNVKPGDFMIIYRCDIVGRGYVIKASSHISIVKSLNDSIITVIEQNTDGALNKSIVKETTFNINNIVKRNNGDYCFRRFTY